MRVRLFGCGLTAVVLAMIGGAHPAKAQPPPIGRTYILTQAICLPPPSATGSPQPAPSPPQECITQTLPVDAAIQVQLPGTPSRWRVVRQTNVLGDDGPGPSPKVIPNPLRIPGTSEIYIFGLKAGSPGTGSVTIQESPPFLAPGGLLTFRFTIQPRTQP